MLKAVINISNSKVEEVARNIADRVVINLIPQCFLLFPFNDLTNKETQKGDLSNKEEKMFYFK